MSIDEIIVLGFLLLNLLVGLYYGRNVKTVKNYALGERNFSTSAIVATIVATWISGGSFSFYMAETYMQGLRFVLAIIADALSFLIIAYIFIPRMQHLLGKLSVAEVMGDLYGKNIRIITAITGFIGTIGALAIQFKIFSEVLKYFFAISAMYSTIISGLVVIIYSTFGGIKSVTLTDIVQIITFSLVIPIILFVIWNTIDDVEAINNLLINNPNFDIVHVLDYTQLSFWGTVAIFIYFLVPGFSPATFQRISIAKDIEQSKKSFLLAAIYLLIIELLIAGIAILVLIKDPNIEPYGILSYIIDNYAYTGLRGIIVIGIMAMIMSTADSYISSASVLFSHDFCAPLGIINNKQKLLFTRIFCTIIGLVSIVMALKFDNIFNLFVLGYGPYMTIVTVPFMLSILGFNTTNYSIMCGMISGITTSICWKYFSTIEVDDTILGMLFNLLVILISHYFFSNNRIIKLNKPQFSFKLVALSYWNQVKIYSSNINLEKIYSQITPKQDYYFSLMSIYFIISIFSAVYAIPISLRLAFEGLINNIYISSLIVATIFLTYPLWSNKINSKFFITTFWLLGLIYNMIFIPMLFTIISNFGQIQLMILIIDLLILTSLLDWRISLISITAGIFASVKLYNYLYQNFSWSAQFKIIYILLLVSSVLIAFLKPKQEHLEETEAKVGSLESEVTELGYEVSGYRKQVSNLNEQVTHYSERVEDQAKEIERLGATAQRILNNVNHELRLPVGNVMNFAQILSSGIDKMSSEELKLISDEVYTNSTRLSTMILNMLDLAMLSVRKIELNKKTINLGELVEERVKRCRAVYLGDKKIDFRLTIEPELLLVVDANYIRQVVDNIVINSINFSEEGLIEVEVVRDDQFARITIIDQGRGIPTAELYDIFTPFKMGSNTESKSQGRGVGLALCKAAIEAHGGTIKAESNGNQGATFIVSLPIYRM